MYIAHHHVLQKLATQTNNSNRSKPVRGQRHEPGGGGRGRGRRCPDFNTRLHRHALLQEGAGEAAQGGGEQEQRSLPQRRRR